MCCLKTGQNIWPLTNVLCTFLFNLLFKIKQFPFFVTRIQCGKAVAMIANNSDRLLFRKKMKLRYMWMICLDYENIFVQLLMQQISLWYPAFSNKVLRELCSRSSTITVCISLCPKAIKTLSLLYQECLRLGRTHLIYWVIDHQDTHAAQNFAYNRDAL